MAESSTPQDRPWPPDQAAPALAAALSKAVQDRGFRERCLVSAEAARRAVEEASGTSVPDDVEIRFYPRQELDRLFVVWLPPFEGEDGYVPAPQPEDYVLCTWPIYRENPAPTQTQAPPPSGAE